MTKGVVLFGDTIEIKKGNYCGGRPEPNVESTVRWRGKILKKSNQPCSTCKKDVDFDYQIVEKGGTRLAIVTRAVSNLGKLRELSNKLEKKQQKLDYYQFNVEHEILNIKYEKLMAENKGGVYSSDTSRIPIQCPNCGTKLGIADVTLGCSIPELNAPDLGWAELWSWIKKVSEGTKAKVAARLGYLSWENCIHWVDSPDIERLKKLLDDFLETIENLDVSTELIEDSVGNLQNQVQYHSKNLSRRLNLKRQRIVSAILALANEEAHRRMPL